MPRPKAQGSRAKNQLQLAIALSTSLEESKTRELSKLAEELPADVIEGGAIPHNIKQMQKEFLERLKPVSAAPSKRQRKTAKIQVPALYTRSSEERMRIITEKVALVLIKEGIADFYQVSEATCRKLYLNFNNEPRLWNISFLVPAIEERHLYYVKNLSAFISSTKATSNSRSKNRFPLPGRFLTPQKREPDDKKPFKANISESQDANRMSDTQNWSNTSRFNNVDLSNQEVQLEFQNDWLAMLNNPTMSDVTIYTKQQKQIAAHKLILYARCPIILDDLDIGDSLRWDNINYNDALAFLQFIYSGQLAASLQFTENPEGIVLLSRKYKVLDLLKHIYASDDDLYGTDEVINEGLTSAALSSVQGNQSVSAISEKTTQVLGCIEISSDDSAQSEKTPERKNILVKRSRVSFSPISHSPNTSDNSKRKLDGETTPKKLTTKKLCIEVSDEEEVPSPFKCTLLDLSVDDMLASNPSTPLRETIGGGSPLCIQVSDGENVQSPFKCSNLDLSISSPATPVGETSDDAVSPSKDKFNVNSWQFPDDELDTLSTSLKADAMQETTGPSVKHSPLKTPISRLNVTAQDYKVFLEDSFHFDLKTPPQVCQEPSTPMRTPLTDVKTSSPATPMPDYWAMNSDQLQAELCKFGLKRSLPRNKGIKMLKHIYDKLHPLVEVVVKGGRELFIPIGDKTPIRSADAPTLNPVPLAVPTNVNEPEPPDDGQSLSESSSDEGEMMEESLFADEDVADYEGLADMKTITLAWISSKRDLYEKVLRYEPIWLESVHRELKEDTQQNIKLNQLMNILDEEGVTFRMTQKNTGGRKKKRASPKKKPLTLSQMPKE